MISTKYSSTFIKSNLMNESDSMNNVKVEHTKANVFSQEHFNILNITWNVNSKLAVSDIEKLFDCSKVDAINDFSSPHIVVVGLQEIVELSATNAVSNEFSQVPTIEKVNSWIQLILRTLNSKEENKNEKYVLLSKCHMLGLMLSIFIRKNLKSSISNIKEASLPRGVGGLGNKGAIYIRFQLCDTSVCFINAHFAAHQHAVEKRNQDYHAIVSTPVFENEDYKTAKAISKNYYNSDKHMNLRAKINSQRERLIDIFLPKSKATITDTSGEISPNSSVYERDSSFSVLSDSEYDEKLKSLFKSRSLRNLENELAAFSPLEHDIVVFLGDLNYRIGTGDDISTSQVFETLYRGNYLDLLQYDQLLKQKLKLNTVFENFFEGEIMFKPTYKFIPGTDSYDDRIDKKLRCPAWCDRILWHTRENEDIIDLVTLQNTTSMEVNERFISQFEKIGLFFYDSCSELSLSDHKPVRAYFCMSVKKVDYELREKLLMESMKDLMAKPNSLLLPKLLTLEELESLQSNTII